MNDSTNSEIVRFLFIGATTVLIDILVYCFCLKLGVWVPWSKGVGFVAGSLFAYFANKSWTFQTKQRGVNVFMKFIMVYGINLGINVGINSGVIQLLGRSERAIQIAFIGATGFSAIMNFLGMKYFVFKSTTQEADKQI